MWGISSWLPLLTLNVALLHLRSHHSLDVGLLLLATSPNLGHAVAHLDSTHGHHQMVNTKIRLIVFFAAKNGEALCRQQKQDQELTVTQIMNSLLPNSDSN